MRYSRKVFGRAVEVDPTPLIDVTFQLIAFFTFALNFAEVDQDVRIRLPVSDLAKPSEEVLEYPLTIHVTKEGSAILGGELLSLVQLRTALLNRAEFMRRMGNDPSDVTMIVRADAEAPTGQVQEIIQVCQEREFHKFSLRVQQRGY